MSIRSLFAALVLAAAVTAVAATRAHAGTYVVVGCSDLTGSAIRPTDGWYLAAGAYPSRDQCRSRGGLYVTGSLGANLFRFDAPAGTTVARLVSSYRAHLPALPPSPAPALVVEAGHEGRWRYIPPAGGHAVGTATDVAGNRVGGDAHGAGSLRIGIRCEPPGPCTAVSEPWARFLALAVVLDDSRVPGVAVRAPAGHLRGAVRVAVAAHDAGGGVFERTLELDGRLVAGARLCDTVTASLGAQRHVTQRVPCPLDAPAVARVDTREVGDGPHTLLARVEDVAGNVQTAVAPITVDNLPPRRGVVTLAGDPAEALSARPDGFTGEDVTFDHRWQRCGDAGCAEIPGATAPTYRVRSLDAGRRLRAVVRATDGGGSVRAVSAPSGVVPTRTGARLTAWFEHGQRRLRRATVTWPARAHIGGRLTDLRGRPLARTPVRMLERLAGRGWRPIAGVRTRRDGRLSAITRAGPSRAVRLVRGSAAMTLRLVVRAAVRVRIRRYGPLTVLSGSVRGGHVPGAGLRVRLQSRGGGTWRTRARLRTDGLGRFTAFGRVPAGARLRVVVPAQPGYPYARGVGRP